MGNVIYVDFRKTKYSLQQARKFLGAEYFRKALHEWSLGELQSVANHPECFLTDAHEAYTAVLEFRIDKEVYKNGRKPSGF